jgi:DNA-binding CsgD family transcriptional regulator
MAVARTNRADPRQADPRPAGAVRAGTRPRFGPSADPDHGMARLRAGMSDVRLALGLVDLTDMRIRAVSNAACEELGLPADRIVGRRAEDVIDPRDRPGATTALEALRAGAIEFYRAYRHGANVAASKRVCAWVRRLDLGGRPYAFIRFGDPNLPPSPWPAGVDVIQKAVAVAVTDAHGIVQTASLYPDLGDDYCLDDILGLQLLPSPNVEEIVTLSDWRAARIDGVSIAYGARVRNCEGVTAELEAIATALVGASGWLVVLVQMDPPASVREAELEGHLWRIAAEIEASGILMRAGRTPGLSLARIGDAASLTPRQWEVLRRLAAGQRVPTIAAELFVSQSTVRNHLSAIFERFNVHSQAELLARLTPTDAPSI